MKVLATVLKQDLGNKVLGNKVIAISPDTIIALLRFKEILVSLRTEHIHVVI